MLLELLTSYRLDISQNLWEGSIGVPQGIDKISNPSSIPSGEWKLNVYKLKESSVRTEVEKALRACGDDNGTLTHMRALASVFTELHHEKMWSVTTLGMVFGESRVRPPVVCRPFLTGFRDQATLSLLENEIGFDYSVHILGVQSLSKSTKLTTTSIHVHSSKLH